MIAAIYARKSTQQDVADDAKSVSRQIEHARAYAAKKGWTADEASIFDDDGISGAEFSKRPGLLRLMAALKPRPSFQVLVMSEESRLGRETIETAFLLKQLVQAGVRVFFYLNDSERTIETPMDKIMLSLAAFADELEREKARQRTTDALMQRARVGHVTGGLVFGYDNFTILAESGKKSHVVRRVNGPQAAIVREIFDRYVSGWGYSRIAKALNAVHAPSPRPAENKPAGWSPSSVRCILRRDLYRGIVTWNRSQKRADEAVLAALKADALDPTVVSNIVNMVFERLTPRNVDVNVVNLQRDLREVEGVIANLARAIERASDLDPLIAQMRDRQQERERLIKAIATAQTLERIHVDRDAIEAEVQAHVATWRETLATAAVEGGRDLLREVLTGPLMFTANQNGYWFRGPVVLGALIAGAINAGAQQVASPGGGAEVGAGAHKVASPGIPSWNQIQSFLSQMARLRESEGSAA